jgi:SAM-dependent methyltransferase
MSTPRKAFDKHAAYALAVQSPSEDARFLRRVYSELSGKTPKTLREDFCGTFALCCEWVKHDDSARAWGLDIDPDPIKYGAKNYLAQLEEKQRSRVQVRKLDVMSPRAPRADLICAFNFSYFVFQERRTLVRYFESCRKRLAPKGLFVVDIFGGPQHGHPCVETKRLSGMKYYFEQSEFDPITNKTRFHLSFERTGERKRNRVFSYDWRMYSIPEIRDAMLDAGFKDTVVYWEGTARDGRGSGVFHRRAKGEPCEVWVAYIVGRI